MVFCPLLREETANFISTCDSLWHVLYEFISSVLLHLLHLLLVSAGGTSLELSLVLSVEPWNLAQPWYFSEMEKEKYVLHTWTPQAMGT